MKNKLLFICITILLITGCGNKYEKDTSYNTDLNGTYTSTMGKKDSKYFSEKSYTIEENKTYKNKIQETINGKTTQDSSNNGDILSIEEISDDITKITLDKTVLNLSTYKESNVVLYKYKNILGAFYGIEISEEEDTFEIHCDSFWFDMDGQYHLCDDNGACDCNSSCPKYVRKDDIIYFQYPQTDNYTIGFYIVDEGFFAPEYYKEK